MTGACIITRKDDRGMYYQDLMGSYLFSSEHKALESSVVNGWSYNDSSISDPACCTGVHCNTLHVCIYRSVRVNTCTCIHLIWRNYII